MTDQPPEQEFQVALMPEMMSGVYANMARVSHSAYEFTIDFCRLDLAQGPPPVGIVVARVSMSPLLVSQLIDALGTNWARYAESQMPPEVRDEQHRTTTDPTDDGTPETSA